MKKLLLLLAVSAGLTTAFAQNNKSVVFLPEQHKLATPGKLESNKPVGAIKPNVSTSKTTAVGGAGWFDYVGIMSTAATKGYYNVVYQDSNVYYNGTSGQTFIWLYGMGASFDPTDSIYSAEETSLGIVPNPDSRPPIHVTAGNAYTVDSIAFPNSYERHTSNNDSLYIEIAKTGGTNPGVYALQYNTPSAHGYNVTADGRPRFGTAIYSPATNRLDSILPANIVRLGYAMDATMHADTTANGYLNKFLNGVALPTPLSVAPGEIVVAWVSFKSGVSYPLGTIETSANTIRMYTADVSGVGAAPKQTVGSYEAGLLAVDNNKYEPIDSAIIGYQSHNVVVPSVAYLADGFTHRFAFHVDCPTCPTLSVADIQKDIVANAYPNPATDEVRVPFTLKATADVNVTLTNLMGQVVKSQNMGNTAKAEAVFSTSDLANGVYIFTVEANGQRQTGRVVVSH